MATKVTIKQENKLYHADCLEMLKTLESNSVDAVITDPPAGIAFMSKDWDKDKGGRDKWIAWMTEVMTECNRVLKHGGHAIVWALPRTSHWTAMAIEDAGFEIRDVIHHIFNQGFSKSMNVGKALDKKLGNEREVVGKSKRHNSKEFGGEKYGKYQGGVPCATKGKSEWEGWGTHLKPAAEHWILARKPIAEKTIVEQVLKTGT